MILRLLTSVTLAGCVFGADVMPLLKQKCAACHEGAAKTSGFSVATPQQVIAGGTKYGKAIVGGHPEESVLLKLIRGEMKPRMPVGGELTKAEIASIESWIRTLPPEHVQAKSSWRWPYEKPVRHQPPAVTNTAWIRNDVDR